MYNYAKEKPNILTDEGQKQFLAVRDKTQQLFKVAGAARAAEMMQGQTGSMWTTLACIDRMVELGEIKELTGPEVWGQYRVFVATRDNSNS